MASPRRSYDALCHGRVEEVDNLLGTLIMVDTSDSQSEEGPKSISLAAGEGCEVSDRFRLDEEHSSVPAAQEQDRPVHGPGTGVLQADNSFHDDIGVSKLKISDDIHLATGLPSSDQQKTQDTSDMSESNSAADSADDKDLHAKSLKVVENIMQGFLFGTSPGVLLGFLENIVRCSRNYGIYISKILNPKCVGGVIRYRKNMEYTVIQHIHGSQEDGPGVYLCSDKMTKKHFILKRIQYVHHRLIGVEFLCQENKNFLPKIYGVFKEENDEIHIFQEYVEGGTLLKCKWNLLQIRQFAEEFLKAFRYLHSLDLAHGDVKMMNVVVRDPKDPKSFVIIDFESMKRQGFKLHHGGHTNLYLPPWHKRQEELTAYHPILKTFDLWATGCILISLMTRLGGSFDKHPELWTEVTKRIRQNCPQCKSPDAKKRNKLCEVCKGHLLQHLTHHGYDIIKEHFHREMPCKTEEESKALDELRSLLNYLTSDATPVDSINVDSALRALRGQQLSFENEENT